MRPLNPPRRCCTYIRWRVTVFFCRSPVARGCEYLAIASNKLLRVNILPHANCRTSTRWIHWIFQVIFNKFWPIEGPRFQWMYLFIGSRLKLSISVTLHSCDGPFLKWPDGSLRFALFAECRSVRNIYIYIYTSIFLLHSDIPQTRQILNCRLASMQTVWSKSWSSRPMNAKDWKPISPEC